MQISLLRLILYGIMTISVCNGYCLKGGKSAEGLRESINIEKETERMASFLDKKEEDASLNSYPRVPRVIFHRTLGKLRKGANPVLDFSENQLSRYSHPGDGEEPTVTGQTIVNSPGPEVTLSRKSFNKLDHHGSSTTEVPYVRLKMVNGPVSMILKSESGSSGTLSKKMSRKNSDLAKRFNWTRSEDSMGEPRGSYDSSNALNRDSKPSRNAPLASPRVKPVHLCSGSPVNEAILDLMERPLLNYKVRRTEVEVMPKNQRSCKSLLNLFEKMGEIGLDKALLENFKTKRQVNVTTESSRTELFTDDTFKLVIITTNMSPSSETFMESTLNDQSQLNETNNASTNFSNSTNVFNAENSTSTNCLTMSTNTFLNSSKSNSFVTRGGFKTPSFIKSAVLRRAPFNKYFKKNNVKLRDGHYKNEASKSTDSLHNNCFDASLADFLQQLSDKLFCDSSRNCPKAKAGLMDYHDDNNKKNYNNHNVNNKEISLDSTQEAKHIDCCVKCKEGIRGFNKSEKIISKNNSAAESTLKCMKCLESVQLCPDVCHSHDQTKNERKKNNSKSLLKTAKNKASSSSQSNSSNLKNGENNNSFITDRLISFQNRLASFKTPLQYNKTHNINSIRISVSLMKNLHDFRNQDTKFLKVKMEPIFVEKSNEDADKSSGEEIKLNSDLLTIVSRGVFREVSGKELVKCQHSESCPGHECEVTSKEYKTECYKSRPSAPVRSGQLKCSCNRRVEVYRTENPSSACTMRKVSSKSKDSSGHSASNPCRCKLIPKIPCCPDKCPCKIPSCPDKCPCKIKCPFGNRCPPSTPRDCDLCKLKNTDDDCLSLNCTFGNQEIGDETLKVRISNKIPWSDCKTARGPFQNMTFDESSDNDAPTYECAVVDTSIINYTDASLTALHHFVTDETLNDFVKIIVKDPSKKLKSFDIIDNQQYNQCSCSSNCVAMSELELASKEDSCNENTFTTDKDDAARCLKAVITCQVPYLSTSDDGSNCIDVDFDDPKSPDDKARLNPEINFDEVESPTEAIQAGNGSPKLRRQKLRKSAKSVRKKKKKLKSPSDQISKPVKKDSIKISINCDHLNEKKIEAVLKSLMRSGDIEWDVGGSNVKQSLRLPNRGGLRGNPEDISR